jgi:toxin YoeB
MKSYIFEEDAFEQLSDWAIYDKKKFLKICELLKEINRTPFIGKGKPEPLQHTLSGCWSRRIDEKHRLVYKISKEGDILILSCKGHYDDK